MRGRDEETGEFFSPSRSQNRREALEVLALGEKLVALTEAQLAKLPRGTARLTVTYGGSSVAKSAKATVTTKVVTKK